MRLSFYPAAALVLIQAEPAVDYAEQRERLVRNFVEPSVRDRRVIQAMRDVRRERYVPAAVRWLAYRDAPMPIGHGQTISQPSLVAMMTEMLQPKPHHKVLEIGTGSGYQAAVLAKLVRHVYSIEIVPQLAEFARSNLAAEGISNVTVRQGDGYKGWPEQAPFDAVILTAAPPEVPQTLIDHLRPGGRRVAPVGRSGEDQELIIIEKDADGKVKRRSVLPVRFVPMVPGESK